ncbi:MAG: MBL fold metallo-hydrolase [Actinobacteria bacterium]|nr:MBL fold metallo-hydrolase [Actinomycetota bacterium]
MQIGTEVGPGIYVLGAEVVNYHVLEDEGRLTVIDAGGGRHYGQLRGFLDRQGWPLDALEVVLLTHTHSDHIGFAEQARADAGARVMVHEADAVIATGGDDGRSNETGVTGYLRHPAAWKTIFTLLLAGGAKIVPVAEVATFADGEVLDVPGRPQVVHAPGHTLGNSTLHVADRGVLFSGDALVTWNPLTGRDGPQIMPAAFNESSEQALASLDRLEALDAEIVLPGHGPPWGGGIATAVDRARSAGRS